MVHEKIKKNAEKTHTKTLKRERERKTNKPKKTYKKHLTKNASDGAYISSQSIVHLT